MRRAFVTVAILVFVFLVACGGEEGWGAEAREEFIAGCESSGTPNDACVCMQEKLEAKYPDADDPDDFEAEEVTAVAEACVDV